MNDLELFTALILGVVGCGLAFCGYVIGVVVQEAPNYAITPSFTLWTTHWPALIRR